MTTTMRPASAEDVAAGYDTEYHTITVDAMDVRERDIMFAGRTSVAHVEVASRVDRVTVKVVPAHEGKRNHEFTKAEQVEVLRQTLSEAGRLAKAKAERRTMLLRDIDRAKARLTKATEDLVKHLEAGYVTISGGYYASVMEAQARLNSLQGAVNVNEEATDADRDDTIDKVVTFYTGQLLASYNHGLSASSSIMHNAAAEAEAQAMARFIETYAIEQWVELA